MFLLRLVLIALSLLGPPVGATASTQLAEDECDEFVHDVAVELRAIACQPPPRTPPVAAARRRRARARRRSLRRPAPGRRRTARVRVFRRVLYADGDDPDQA